MPTNLPPEYFDAERQYKEATTPAEKVEALEELIRTIPKHKGTDKLRADYRKKISKFKSQAQQASKISGKHESHFHIEKEGDGRVLVIGAANVGKSSLVSALSHATPEISNSPFSTWKPTPGMLDYKGVQIQLIDTPPIDRDFIEPEFVDLIKHSNLLLLLLDLQAFPIQQFQITEKILTENKIFPYFKKPEQIERKTYYIPMQVVVNKNDGKNLDEEYNVLKELIHEDGWSILPISVTEKRNLTELMDLILKRLRIIRVFSKKPGNDPDMTRPFVLIEGANVEEFALKVHKDIAENLKSARIWGTDVHDGQQVGRDHLLYDGDIVELHS
jgi:ribosome-interacting GTPase 1